MKHSMILSLILSTAHIASAIIEPKMPSPTSPASSVKNGTSATLTTLVIPSATQIHIYNTSDIAAPLTGVWVTYSTQIDNDQSKMHQGKITINPARAIKPHQEISFRPEITIQSPHASISGQFETVTSIMINSQLLKLPTPMADATPIYIAYANGTWKITKKPHSPKKAEKEMAKTSSIEATTVPYLKTTAPGASKLKTMPVQSKMLHSSSKNVRTNMVPPMPKMPLAAEKKSAALSKKSSIAAKSSAKAVNSAIKI